jgi:tRNA 2-thiocytidine biosynthesis protein TtcA
MSILIQEADNVGQYRRSRLTRLEKKLLHDIGKAIADYEMIKTGDKVMVCLSGGKDSYTLLTLLNILRVRSRNRFTLQAFTLDQAQPGWDDSGLREYLTERNIPFEVVKQDTYSIVKEKVPEGSTYCSLCSRLRRGIIYNYAEKNGFTKIALGHHRDDLIQSLLMSIFFKGEISSMPPKLLTDCKRHVLVRPMAYCQEEDIEAYAEQAQFPIIPCNLCGTQEGLMRQRIKALIKEMAGEHPNIPANMLHALKAVRPSQLMDKELWDFSKLDDEQQESAYDAE